MASLSSNTYSSFKMVLGSFLASLIAVSCGEDPAFREIKPGYSKVGVGSGASSQDESSCDAGSSSENQDSCNTGDLLPSDLQDVKDEFVFKNTGKVDILWVIDSSNSMKEEHTSLGENFSSFMGQLLKSGIDFQTGVTTTDICSSKSQNMILKSENYCPDSRTQDSTHHRGSLVGKEGGRVLTTSTHDIETLFKKYVNVGVKGSVFEHGLKAAEMAVTKSLNGANEDLVRSNAFLAVIIVSDEEDDGIGLGMIDAYSKINYIAKGKTSARYTSKDFVARLSTLKGAGKFSVSAITGTRLDNGKMCKSEQSAPIEEGTQYIAAAGLTGGIVKSICDTDWASSLELLGQDIAGQSNQIVLSKKPHLGTIVLEVNGVEMTTWTYNSGNNSIKFNASDLPSYGSEITILYKAAP
jgi:hypothetical protein